MSSADRQSERPRYADVAASKAHGTTYTPKALADFVAQEVTRRAASPTDGRQIRVLDPAVGDGELLVSLLDHLDQLASRAITVHGFETDYRALLLARERLAAQFPAVPVRFEHGSFLSSVLDRFDCGEGLFTTTDALQYDIVVANPPYVRTQVLGATQAQTLASQFGLSGRVDLYHAFVLGISRVLDDNGLAGIIVSNRFMSTKSGASVRAALAERFDVLHAWDLGDTKLFQAAVLPAVLLVQGRSKTKRNTPFTSIYETRREPTTTAADPIEALTRTGVVAVPDGRRFLVRQGTLDTGDGSTGVWRVATKTADAWLAKVEHHRWCSFGDVGRVRVGVKTCADRVFVRNDWHTIDRPELLRPLTTHHVAQQYRALPTSRPREILYPHETVQGRRRAVDLTQYPVSYAYLEGHRSILEQRVYVVKAGRAWYELWVPQDPGAWPKPKLVFRDIAEKPAFWLDMTGSVVNGDCYWLTVDMHVDGVGPNDILWIAAAVGNSTLMEQYYDYRFNNRLYAGRRRYATQYVSKFPLPNPVGTLGRAIVVKAKEVFETLLHCQARKAADELDSMVWEAFGLPR